MDPRIQNASKATPPPFVFGLPPAANAASKSPAARAAAAPKVASTPAAPATGKSELIASSSLQSFITSLRSSAKSLNNGASAAAAQARQDRLAGKGTISGMSEFSDIVLQAYQIIAGQAQRSNVDLGAVSADPVGALGKLTQGYLIDQVTDRFLTDARGFLGLDSATSSTNPGTTAPASSSTSTSTQTTTANSGATAGAAAAELGLDTLGGQIIGGIGAAYSLYNVFDNWGQTTPGAGAVQGFAAGSYIGSLVPIPGATFIGGAIGGLVGFVSGLFKTGKHKDQLARDKVRTLMKQNGFVNGDWQIQLADGVLYDIGKDGEFKLTNTDGSKRRAYEVDFGNPLAAETVGWVQPLAALITGGDPKLGSDFAGYFTNAVLSNASDREGVRKNALAFLQSLNVKPEQVVAGITELVKAGRIDQAHGQAYVDGFASLIGATRPAA